MSPANLIKPSCMKNHKVKSPSRAILKSKVKKTLENPLDGTVRMHGDWPGTAVRIRVRVSQTYDKKNKQRTPRKKWRAFPPLDRLRKSSDDRSKPNVARETPRQDREKREERPGKRQAGRPAGRQASRQAGRHARHRATTTQHDTQYPAMLCKKKTESRSVSSRARKQPWYNHARNWQKQNTERKKESLLEFPSAKAALVQSSVKLGSDRAQRTTSLHDQAPWS